MEKNQREQSLGDKLRDHQVPVDQSALWEGIKNQIPIKRKNSYWPLPFVFLLGTGLGFGITELSHINKLNILETNNKHLAQNIAQLELRLQTCEQQKIKESDVTALEKGLEEAKAQPIESKRILPAGKPMVAASKSGNIQLAPEKQEDQIMDSNNKNSIPLSDPFQEVISLPTPMLELHHATTWQLAFSPVFTKPETNRLPLVWFFEASAGPNLVEDLALGDHEFPLSKHQSLFHVQIETGVQKHLLGKLYGNLGLSYQFAASQQTYQTSKFENIFITDTMGILIGTDGLTQVDIGDVLAQKWVHKSGKAYHTRHVVSLRPGLEYEVYQSKGKHLSLSLSLSIPVWYQNTGSLVNTFSGKQALRNDQFLKPEWPWSFGMYYQWPMKTSNVGLMLRIHHDKQKIVFNENIYARKFWLPQAGMRILF